MIKYPSDSLKVDSKHTDIKYHKAGYFQSDKEIFKRIADRTGVFCENKTEFSRHPLTYLLEAADDIAYSTADLEDGFKKGMFNLETFYEHLMERYKHYFEEKARGNNYQKQYTNELFEDLMEKYRSKPSSIDKNITDIDLYAIQNWIVYVKIGLHTVLL